MKTDPVPSNPTAAFTRLEACVVAACASFLLWNQFALANFPRGAAAAARCADNQRRLLLACQMYAGDNNRFFPPNPDDGNSNPGFNWVPGQAGTGGAQQFNPDILANPRLSLLAVYLNLDPEPFQCPAVVQRGTYSGTNSAYKGTRIGPARAVSMNGAVGTDPALGAKLPVHGPWLDNAHGHTRNGSWRTYGRDSDLVAPGPALTAVLLEEDETSLNDGHFGFGMQAPEWIDWPATRHDGAGTVGFADGHVETHRWTDPRTRLLSSPRRLAIPDSPDYAWLRERISAAKSP